MDQKISAQFPERPKGAARTVPPEDKRRKRRTDIKKSCQNNNLLVRKGYAIPLTSKFQYQQEHHWPTLNMAKLIKNKMYLYQVKKKICSLDMACCPVLQGAGISNLEVNRFSANDLP